MNISKRQTLVQLGVTSFSFLSGCCCLKSPVDPNLSSVVEPKINPWLSPLGIVRASTAPSLCIDTHAHFFNASDINVRGYFAESIGHSLPPQLRKLVELIAPFVQLLAEIAPLAKDEYQEIVQRGKTVPFQTKAAFEIELQNITNQRRDMIAQHIYDTLKASQVPVEYEKLKQQAIALRGGVSTAAAVAFSLENVRRALDRTATRQNRLFSTAEFQVAAIDPDGIFEFIGHMLGNRWMSLRSYRDVYSTSTGAFGIDAVFGSLIDFDYWLDCFPGSAREDQMRLQSLLSLASGGYMLPLISYNPWTDMKTGGASLALVRKAVSDYGFIGVKIYPPMGYFPYGNANAMPPVKSDKPRPSDLHELDRRLCDFFDLCAELKVPVIAHTGQSMGRDDASDRYDMFGGPRGWRSLLARSMKGRQVPIIQAGHFGGDTTNSGADGSNWSAVFAGMMAEAKGGKLYADVGYWTAPTGNEYDPKCEGLRGRVGCALKINPAAKSRIMYGTDWFMTSKEPNWNEYPANISLALGDLVGRDELFAKNALDCYGLGENGDNVVRLQSRFKNAGIVAPAWLGSAIR